MLEYVIEMSNTILFQYNRKYTIEIEEYNKVVVLRNKMKKDKEELISELEENLEEYMSIPE